MQKNNFHVNEHSLKTAISNVEPNKLTTRGYNQQDLIEKIRYGDMIFLILRGRLPSIKESKMFNHVLVSFCDHGVTPPSTQTARIIASSCGCHRKINGIISIQCQFTNINRRRRFG